VSSRREEKERRRQERMEREAAEARARQRRQRLSLVLGAVVATAVIVAGAIALASSGGGEEDAAPKREGGKTLPIPQRKTSDLQAAARAAGCRVQPVTPPASAQQHVQGRVNYPTNPPTGFNHNPEAASDGIYDPGKSPQTEQVVHAFEHGMVAIWYRPGTDSTRRSQLETLVNEPGARDRGPGYKQLLVENRTNMPFAVAASAWTGLIGCPQFNDRIFDALRAFRDEYTNKAPEAEHDA
jgi:hypothetical protein